MSRKRLIACLLALSMILPWTVPAEAAKAGNVSFEEVSNDRVSATLLPELETVQDDLPYEEKDQVRVSIVLDEKSTVEMGYEIADIAENDEAVNYRQELQRKQEEMTKVIEKEIGENLDVQWNLTLAANLISANVAFGQIDEIASIEGISDVVIEQQYYPIEEADAADNNADPQMILATGMTGSGVAWEAGYTGAGTRIAIIDTGIDTDHQSFSEAGYLYALGKNAVGKGMTEEAYIQSLDLLDAAEINERLFQLNVVGKDSTAKGETLYKSGKIAFAFNYVDSTDDYVTHDLDTQTDHGSHVAGIAAANRYIQQDDAMVSAADAVKVVGNAPDAQLLIMKVFGQQGGAYDSDYMAAIEDACMLGADSVNLSLGTAMNGFSNAGSTYERVMENLEKAGAVVAMAAGNEGSWAVHSANDDYLANGLLYAEDVMYSRMGSPATYTNSMAVASVDNDGQISNAYLSFGEGEDAFIVGYSETLYNDMKAMTSLDTAEEGGTAYDFVMIEGLGQAGDLDFIDVKGKIVMIPRGELAFYEKATYAVNEGAIATIVYNNVDGTIGMDLTDYHREEPAVAITKGDAEKIRNIATENTDLVGKRYYTGTLRIHGTASILEDENDYYTMSYFSSWGSTGDLALKPEVTGPGGNIYSVRGDTAATDTYKVNSGTSMASPQVAGVSALIQQYIAEKELTKAFGHSTRQIAQSLLMSTSVPLKDANGNYYSLLQQGSGLAHAANAVNTDVYIMMQEDAGLSYADGKVKAELGDDPEREGIYEFTFDLYNTNATEDRTYKLSAELFTQDILSAPATKGSELMADYQKESTRFLDSYALFLDDAGITIRDNCITVPAGGTETVKARLVITDEGKAWLDAHYTKGAYIQGFVTAEHTGDTEGLKLSTHTIAVLAFYGNWTDPSMYDSPSYHAGEIIDVYSTLATTDKSRTPYLLEYAYQMGHSTQPVTYGTNYAVLRNSDGQTYIYGGNPLVADEVYHPERNALSGNVILQQWTYRGMRDSCKNIYLVRNDTTGEVYLESKRDFNGTGVYYAKSSGAWQGGFDGGIYLDFQLPEVPEGEVVEFSATRLPEYYREDRMGANATPGSGATLCVSAIIDSTAPVGTNVNYDGSVFEITASDENYIAAVVLYNGTGTEVISYSGAKDEIAAGEEAIYTLKAQNLAAGEYLLQVYDYAMNASTYAMTIDGTQIQYRGSMLAYNLDKGTWVQVDKNADSIPAVSDKTRTYTAATAVEEKIYAIAYGTELFCLNVADPEKSSFVGDTGYTIVDLAYNEADGNLYGISDLNKMIRIDSETGKGILVGTVPVQSNTLACDAEGIFYSNLYGSGKIYSYNMDALKAGDDTLDFDADGTVNLTDAQALLDYLTGKRAEIQNLEYADVDGDADVDTYDVYLLLDKLPSRVNLVTDTGIVSCYMQAMEIDPNNGTLYWTSYSTELIGKTEVGFSFLYEIDIETGAYTRFADLWDQLSSFVILDKYAGSMYGPVDGISGVIKAEEALSAEGIVTTMTSTAQTAGIACVSGVDNSIKADQTKKEAVEVTLELTADAQSSNGLYTVSYDPELLKYVSASGVSELISIHGQEGEITFGYAGKESIGAEEVVATVKFETALCAAQATVLCKEINNSHPDSQSVQDVGAHSWGEWTVTKDATCMESGEQERTCESCSHTQIETIEADETLHSWSDWETIESPVRATPGVQEHSCAYCEKTVDRWVLPQSMVAMAQSSYFGKVDIYQNLVDYGAVTGAAVESVSKLSYLMDQEMRYLVTLTADTPLDNTIHVHLQPTAVNGSGHGSAIKKEIVESVGWDEDDTEYDITLENGIGKLTAYSYISSGDYVTLEIYFVVGETGSGTGHVNYLDLPEMSNTTDYNSDSGRITKLGIWECPSVSKSMWNVSEDETLIEGNIWLDTQTPSDAVIYLEYVTQGRISSLTEAGSDVSKCGSAVQLVNGKATVEVKLTTSAGTERTYLFHLRNHVNRAPVLTDAAQSKDRAKVNTLYTLDLSKLFTDLDGDSLTYSVSVNGEDAAESEAIFSILPEETGEMTLVITANDGFMDSAESYTLILSVTDTAFVPGDVNDDGVVNLKDVTLLKRFVAKWPDVTINEEAADVDASGSINGKDITLIKRYIAQWPGVSLG